MSLSWTYLIGSNLAANFGRRTKRYTSRDVITDKYVAIIPRQFGFIFAVLFGMALLLSTTKCSSASPVLSKLTRVTRNSEDNNSSNHILSPEVADKVRRPCPPEYYDDEPDSRKLRQVVGRSLTNYLRTGLLPEIRLIADTFVRERPDYCSYDYARLTHLKSPESLQNMSVSRVMEYQYDLLVRHAANILHMYDDEKNRPLDCADDRNYANLTGTFEVINSRLRNIMCHIQIISHSLNYRVDFNATANSALDESGVVSYSDCGSRLTRYCQVIKSLAASVDNFLQYLNLTNAAATEVSDSTSR